MLLIKWLQIMKLNQIVKKKKKKKEKKRKKREYFFGLLSRRSQSTMKQFMQILTKSPPSLSSAAFVKKRQWNSER